jgi:hypothetical protein
MKWKMEKMADFDQASVVQFRKQHELSPDILFCMYYFTTSRGHLTNWATAVAASYQWICEVQSFSPYIAEPRSSGGIMGIVLK